MYHSIKDVYGFNPLTRIRSFRRSCVDGLFDRLNECLFQSPYEDSFIQTRIYWTAAGLRICRFQSPYEDSFIQTDLKWHLLRDSGRYVSIPLRGFVHSDEPYGAR